MVLNSPVTTLYILTDNDKKFFISKILSPKSKSRQLALVNYNYHRLAMCRLLLIRPPYVNIIPHVIHIEQKLHIRVQLLHAASLDPSLFGRSADFGFELIINHHSVIQRQFSLSLYKNFRMA